MSLEESQEILREVNGDQSLSGENVIEKIKKELQAKHEDVYREWEKSGFDICYIFTETDSNFENTLLDSAVALNLQEVVRALIEKEANYSGDTPFSFAVMDDRVNVVKFLLDNKIYQIDPAALHFASERGYTKMVRLLLEGGAKVDVVYGGNTPLHCAAERDYTIDRSGDVIMANGWKLLGDDRKSFSKEIVELLLAAGAKVDVVDGFGRTPLHLVASSGSIWVADALIKKGADVNAVDKDGRTALHRAAINKRKDIAEALLKAKAKVDAVDNDGCTPLHCAAGWWHPNQEVVALLLAAGANVNAIDDIGRTPLHLAAKGGHVNTVALLLAKGANPSLKDEWDKTPKGCAKEKLQFSLDSEKNNRLSDIIQLLEEAEKKQQKKEVGPNNGKQGHLSHNQDDERHNLPPVSPSQEDHNASKTSFLSKHKWEIGLGVFVAFTPIVVGVVLPSTTGLPGPTIFVIALLSLVPACIVGGIVASIAGGVARMMSQPNAEQHAPAKVQTV